VSQTSSAVYTLADQPLAEMGHSGTSRAIGSTSATSSMQASGLPQTSVAFASSSNRLTASDDYSGSNGNAHLGVPGSESQEIMTAKPSDRHNDDSGSYPLQVMNEKVF
jgi:hypothetical protein